MSTNCKTCGAPIIWIVTPAGKAHPVDAKPEKRWVDVARAVYGPSPCGPSGEGWALVDAYISHFATCPNADQHRGKR